MEIEAKFLDFYKEDFASPKRWNEIMEQVGINDPDIDHLELKVVGLEAESR